MKEEALKAIEDAARRAAEVAPGAWKLWGMSIMADPSGNGDVNTSIHVAKTSWVDLSGRPRTSIAHYIAELDPPTALDLCVAVRERDATIARLNDRLNLAAALECEIRIDCGAYCGEGTGYAVRRALAERDATIVKLTALAIRLRDVGSGATSHDTHVACPDEIDPQFRNDDCEACAALLEADALAVPS